MTRVTGLYMGPAKRPGACEIYRVNVPLYHLGKHSNAWETRWLHLGDLIDDGLEPLAAAIAESDIIVLPRTFYLNNETREVVAGVIGMARAAGTRTVYEVDDDYSNEFREVVAGEAIEVASWCDAITVTTERLARRMQNLTGRPAYVLPNMLDPELWKGERQTQHNTGDLIIGLTGSATHYNDWKAAAGPLLEILQEASDVRLALVGFHPDYLQGFPRTDYLPVLPYPQYAQIIKSCDIVLAPVDPRDRFNDYKSAIKAVEGMGARRSINGRPAGAAVIATRNTVYSTAIRHEKNGLLVDHTPEDWYDALDRLITYGDFRRGLQYRAYRSVWPGHYDASKGWTKWALAYNKILSKPGNTCKLPVNLPANTHF